MTPAEVMERWVGKSDLKRLGSYLVDLAHGLNSENLRTQNSAREQGEVALVLHDKIRGVLPENTDAGEAIACIALSNLETVTIDFCRMAPRYNPARS